MIKISASGVLLVLILDSSSLDQINSLERKAELAKSASGNRYLTISLRVYLY